MILQNVDRLLLRFDPRYRWRLAGILLLSALQTLLVVARPFPIKLLLETPSVASGDGQGLLPLFIAATLAIELGIFAFRLLEEFASTSLSESLMRRIRGAIARGLMRGSWQKVAEQSIGRVLAAATGDVEVIQRLIKDIIIGASLAFLQLILMLIVIYNLHPALFFVLLFEIAVLSVLIWFYANWRKSAYLMQMQNQERFLGWLSTVQGRNLDLRFHPARGLFLQRTLTMGRALFQRGAMLWRRQSCYFASVECLIGISSAACLVFLALESHSTGRQLGTLLVFLYYTALVFPCLSKIGEAAPLLTDANNAQDRLASLLNLEPVPQQRTNISCHPLASLKPGAQIEFEKVGVRGDGGEWIFRNVDLTIRPGEPVALFGDSGSGKSTVIRLILGLMPADEGIVRIDGRDVRQLTQSQRQRLILCQRSNPVFFTGTVAENMCVGRSDLSKEDFGALLQDVLLSQRMSETEFGVKTIINDRGDPFSQGEQQRISIARCFLAPHPVVILDEALNSLDEKGENAITQALLHRLRDRSLLVVSHRLNVARSFARFVHIVRGQGIVKDG